MKNWAKIQYDYESIYCIVDLHAITVYQPPDELRRKIVELAGVLLAIGIDAKHSALVVQSSVPAHAELAKERKADRGLEVRAPAEFHAGVAGDDAGSHDARLARAELPESDSRVGREVERG